MPPWETIMKHLAHFPRVSEKNSPGQLSVSNIHSYITPGLYEILMQNLDEKWLQKKKTAVKNS